MHSRVHNLFSLDASVTNIIKTRFDGNDQIFKNFTKNINGSENCDFAISI